MVLFRGMAESVQENVIVSDKELIARCIQGDQNSWAQLIGKYQRLIYSVARAACLDREDIADIFQNACLDLYKGLPELRDPQALPAWLITVTRRRASSLSKSP